LSEYERRGFGVRRLQAAIIFSFVSVIASRKVCIGVEIELVLMPREDKLQESLAIATRTEAIPRCQIFAQKTGGIVDNPLARAGTPSTSGAQKLLIDFPLSVSRRCII
jgi:hypothetical protein